MKKEFVTYRHFRRNFGSATACCKVLHEENRMLVGFALCSPEDMFNKKRGRLIAEGRMKTKPIEVPLPACRETFTDKEGNEKEKLGIANALIAYMESHTSLGPGGVAGTHYVDEEKFGLREHDHNGRLYEWFPIFVSTL